ncbi:MAG: DUF5615 family PIN-like protein [Chloroflexota bacterium]
MRLRFLLDERTNYQIAPYLRRLGHDVTAIGQDYPFSLKDCEILAIARREQRIVIINDRDFGEMIVGDGDAHHGVILFRLGQAATEDLIQRMDDVLRAHVGDLHGYLVVSRTRIRLRG